ncbi:HAD-IIA family hydrolase [Capillimicrobium parvum]|uniref:Acid sugar phosphatase n=1 Tax=Capillimicrobium parvum TaxID=2884022 RepID=A0A9E6XUW9_9ACTN|nr:HAD hydrolase-like protein [Capillimicrobium parvum]UGS34221.1 Acid sugar phosphatase [Capillimicrobium parvum]
MRLEDARGFVFDLDGTLVQRGREGLVVIDGAREVLAAIRTSGRPIVVCTNASHVTPGTIAEELREVGLRVSGEEVVTPPCSAISYLRANHPGVPVQVFAPQVTRERMVAEGIDVLSANGDGPQAGAVFVAHGESVDFGVIERAARAVIAGAPLLTASYVSAYAGADGPIFSRGAMLTAALAKATGAAPRIVGKPSQASLDEISGRMGGIPAAELAIVGDDVALEVELGHIGGSYTVLVRSGMTGGLDLTQAPDRHRPHETVDTVAELLPRLRP